ncbi:MAG: GHMP kinase [Armatimonadota bacterium]|nr:GHMP kinase [Armatimonadota bacterium]
MIYRSRAPLRISFAGGGTDVSPYFETYGGVVLSTTINKYAYATVSERRDEDISVASLDYDTVAKYRSNDKLLYNGELDLVKAVLRRMRKGRRKLGVDLFLHSDAPPGSGLGSSSTMVVALIGAFRAARNLPLTNYDIAELAYQIERVDLGIKGGMQDQYAATFGGFNLIEFNSNSVIVNPLRMSADVLNELEYSLLLCYTGRTRLSAHILDRQISSVTQQKGEVMDSLHRSKTIAIELKNALLQGRLCEFGSLLHEAWIEKKKLDTNITSSQIDELYAIARKNGVLGGKILGAGGGGYLLLFCDFKKKHVAAQKLEAAGGQIVQFGFDFQGLQTWEVRSQARRTRSQGPKQCASQ